MQSALQCYPIYEQLSAELRRIEREFPELVQVRSIGQSHEGREVWVAVVTSRGTGPDTDKPAFWVDANIHSLELIGSVAALRLIDRLARGYASDPLVTRCLDTRTFYIVPRVNPDGAELALSDRPVFTRSSVRPWPYDEAPIGGLTTEDIDGDGRILSMRIADDNGPWKVCPEEPRLLVRRDPIEQGGAYYRVLPEGRLDEHDGVTLRLQQRIKGLDLNRNFPAGWRDRRKQPGSGDYPTSEPEVRNLVDFVIGHPNICGGASLHTYGGLLLRPFSDKPDDRMPIEDKRAYGVLGGEGTRLTGYRAISVYHDFRADPAEVMTGAMDDWLYGERGLFAWTVEIWNAQKAAGIEGASPVHWMREHPIEDDLKMLAFSDAQLQGRGYVDWYAFEHPQLGPIELGGWDRLYSIYNPPARLIAQETDPIGEWLIWHNLLGPQLRLLDTQVESLGDHYYRLRAVVQNVGFLPSYVTALARERRLVRGVVCELQLPEGARLCMGEAREVLGQLEGRARTPSTPLSGLTADQTDERVKVQWVVYAPQGGKVTLTARHERAGTVRATIALG